MQKNAIFLKKEKNNKIIFTIDNNNNGFRDSDELKMFGVKITYVITIK